MNTYYVYIVTNRTRTTLYIGVTNDMARRLTEHQSGEVPGFTSRYRLDLLVFYEEYQDVRDAIAREKQLKGWTRKKKDALVTAQNPLWEDLSSGLLGE